MNQRRGQRAIRVLIVEDSRAQRELLVGLVGTAEGLVVAGVAGDGREAVIATLELRPDVVAMDIHLPILDGYAATDEIMRRCPTPIVLMSSSAGDAARRSVASLAAGALAVVRKPGGVMTPDHAGDSAALLTMLRLMADVPVVTRFRPRTLVNTAWPTPIPGGEQAHGFVHVHRCPEVLAIAASTGGPAAVQTLLNGLGPAFPLPILVVQHIARGFVGALVDWLKQTMSLTVQIARHNERLLPGHVYLAPDEHHLLVERHGWIALQREGDEDAYCPNANTLFESIGRVYGSRAIGVILTGMGDDGVRGLQRLRAAGGYTLAQDEASCIVYGMPRAAVLSQAVDELGSPHHLANRILMLSEGARQRAMTQ
jgi:two-component system, chemotaxis family, protein-glutamate methylesterase/glutaminase